jgi:hypothetical protein
LGSDSAVDDNYQGAWTWVMACFSRPEFKVQAKLVADFLKKAGD